MDSEESQIQTHYVITFNYLHWVCGLQRRFPSVLAHNGTLSSRLLIWPFCLDAALLKREWNGPLLQLLFPTENGLVRYLAVCPQKYAAFHSDSPCSESFTCIATLSALRILNSICFHGCSTCGGFPFYAVFLTNLANHFAGT